MQNVLGNTTLMIIVTCSFLILFLIGILVQNVLDTTILMIIVTSSVLILFAIGFLAVILVGNKRVKQEQEERIASLIKSEQRYKALFENSLAGMMKFNFNTWEIIDANHSLIQMFNCTTKGELQNIFTPAMFPQFEQCSSELKSTGIFDGMEIQFKISNGIMRRYLFSARKDESENIAHGVIIYVSANKMIG